MLRPIAIAALIVGIATSVTAAGKSPLRLVASTQLPGTLGQDEQLWGTSGQKGDYRQLLQAIDYSLRYLQSSNAAADYRRYQAKGLGVELGPRPRERMVQSLKRFRQLVVQSRSPQQLQAAVQKEFNFYQSVGKDNAGTVEFTGYYEAVYTASATPTAEYRYPIYNLPPSFYQWSKPHPTRAQLEGADGLQGSKGRLKGLEIAWLRDRLEAYLIQVQGSAQLRLTNGRRMTVGVAGKTAYPYTSIGKELVKDGKIPQEGLTLPKVIAYFQANPREMNAYLPRNQSFVFFRNTVGGPATGSLSVPVTAERSIATDKSLMPPGALALIQTQIPYPNAAGQLEKQLVSRYVLDQDTGSAIKGAGRVDIFMGTGAQAKARAGLINNPGQLYYLLLK
jgi:membrane-bound lytic murein transglycosylase A